MRHSLLVVFLSLALVVSLSGCGSKNTAPASDTTPPSISSISPSSVTATSAVITWTTNEPANGQVEYGSSPDYGSYSVLQANYETAHSIILTGLTPASMYHFGVFSEDSAGNREKSGENTFTTTAAALIGQLNVHFIDVGQGDSILIDYGIYEALIDGGGSSPGVVGYLRTYVDGPIEVMVATHPHADHIGGLAAVLEAFAVQQIWHNGETSTSQTYANFMNAVRTEGSEVLVARRGQTIPLADLTFNVLSPVDLAGTTNNNSIVLSLSYGQVDWLFTGDAEEQAEAGMVSVGLVQDIEILKVGHHGSRTATSPAFLAAAKPEVAVYMAGAGNSYGHPHAETISALQAIGASIYGTDAYGTTLVTTDGTTYEVQAESGPVSPVNSPTGSGPVISGVATSGITAQGGSISWSTNVPSTSQVEYGKTTSYGLNTGLDGTLVTAHGVSISGLDANATYRFRVKSMNVAGIESVSPDHTFTTAVPAGASDVKIISIFYDGLVPTVESDEYVEITNLGSASQDITGWRLVDIDDGAPSFTFPSYVLAPGASIRVYTNEVHPEWGGFSFNRGSAVWNNSDPDTAALYDVEGNEVSRRSY